MSEPEQDPRRAIRKLNLVGFGAVVVFLGGAGGWATTSELKGAVIAPGTLVVESNVKKVQHPTGGVIGEIYVKEGTLVQEGQVVLRLDDTVTRASLGALRSQLDEQTARGARLLAERDDAEVVTFPLELIAGGREKSVALAIAGEEKLFASRKRGRQGQNAQLRERIGQTKQEIAGLTAQQAAKENEIKYIGEELVGVTQLYKQNLVNIQRFMALQRDQARLQGERGQLMAEIGRASAKISETELQILQLEQDFRTDVLKDLRDSQGKIAELKEKVTAAEDQLKRIDIRAPQTGVVHALSVHTVGGVVGNGETLMEIVPVSDALLIEAKVAPTDIDQVIRGATAIARIMAGNQRTAPDLSCAINYVAADLTREKEQPNQIYYLVRAAIPVAEIARLGELKLVAGMPAELFIQTQDRTPLQYLLKPLREQIARTFRER